MTGRGLDRRTLLRAGLLGLAAACTPRTGSPGPDPSPTAPTDPASTAPATTGGPTADTAPTGSGTDTDAAPTDEPTPAVAATVHLLCRDAWQARPPRSGMQDHRLDRLTVHHTAVAATDETQGPTHLRLYQDLHMDQQGWRDVAYHVAVDRAGYAYELRDWGLVGSTSTAYDPAGHFLLVLDGNFQEHEPTEEQLETAAHVLAWASDHFSIGLDTIVGHRDLASTACPGDALYRRLDQLTGRSRQLADGGVELVQVCGEQGRATVQAITAGTTPPVPPRSVRG